MLPANPNCPKCGGKGYIGYEYCGMPHAVVCEVCYPWRTCPGCGCSYGKGRAEAALHVHENGCKYKTAWGHFELERLADNQ